jgi:dihydropteroate synthase
MDKDTLFYKKRTIRCNSRIIELEDPLIMGILNVTPDSFYDGGMHNSPEGIKSHVEKMLAEGAGIIDIGGYSSRPGAAEVSEKEELERVTATLDIIRNDFPEAILSLDTFRSKVAAKAIEAYHVEIINDISAGKLDPEIVDVVAEEKTAYVAMHMQGTPKTMQHAPKYEHVVKDILDYFAQHIEWLRSKKVNDIIIDPGFGFGKTLDQNYQLLEGLDIFSILEYPLMVGVSRKSMIYKFLNTTPRGALNGTSLLNMIALQKGAKIIRVHDIKEARHTIDIYKKLNEEREKSINLLNNTSK